MNGIFHLCYKLDGGSGLNITVQDLDSLPLRDLDRLIEMLDEQRSREAKAKKGKRT